MTAYILFDDIPDSCESCPIRSYNSECPLQEDIEPTGYEEQKDRCPIRALPRERKHNLAQGYKSGYDNGWNDCLEALMDKYDQEEGQDDDSM